jgi:acetolactate decarboxylase
MTEATLYQHGTLALLVPGLFRGTMRVGELMQHGDTGIGTLTGLDGELVMEAGKVYQVAATGQVRMVGPDELVPFANVHFADYTDAGTLDKLAFTDLQAQLLELMGTQNAFYAVRIHGEFSHVHTRAVAAQSEPYPTLVATAAAQHEFHADDVEGTLSGYFSPALYAGAVSPGFHLHFLSDDHQFGGHVLGGELAEGAVQLQRFNDFQLHLPNDDADFKQADFIGSDVLDQIHQAEN